MFSPTLLKKDVAKISLDLKSRLLSFQVFQSVIFCFWVVLNYANKVCEVNTLKGFAGWVLLVKCMKIRTLIL